MTKWQERYMILFENHVDVKTGEIFDHYFKKDLEYVRSLTKENKQKLQNLTAKLALRYKFPANMVNFLSEFIDTGAINPSLISSYIRIVDGRSQTVTRDKEASHLLWKQYQENIQRFPTHSPEYELKIVIGDEVSREQLRDYITEHWDMIEAGIKAKPRAHERSIFRSHFNAKRDYRVLALLESGLTHDEVALKIQQEYPGYSPTYSDIQKIKSKVKIYSDTTFDI